jgi:hypothetical protein
MPESPNPQRSTSVLFRMSHEDKRRLREQADQAGISVQAYLERTVLGYPEATTLPPGRRPRHQQELPLTG